MPAKIMISRPAGNIVVKGKGMGIDQKTHCYSMLGFTGYLVYRSVEKRSAKVNYSDDEGFGRTTLLEIKRSLKTATL
jgi:hypothetical protein